MARIGQWKRILGQTGKQKVLVKVGGKHTPLTETQSYRFSELREQRAADSGATDCNPLQESRYSLEDASFRLMIDEDQLLQKAAAGSLCLYTNAEGLSGRWQRDGDCDATQSTVRTLKSGFLALDVRSCRELANEGRTSVTVLHFDGAAESAASNVDLETLETLNAWGPGEKRFHLQEPFSVDRDSVVLLAPLLPSDSR